MSAEIQMIVAVFVGSSMAPLSIALNWNVHGEKEAAAVLLILEALIKLVFYDNENLLFSHNDNMDLLRSG